MRIMCISLISLLAGCSTLRTLEPNSLPIEIDHVSHLTQHQPFTDHPTAYGYEAFSIGAKWRPTPNFSISVSEGAILDHGYYGPTGKREYGALLGPREVFTGRLVYEIPLK